MKGAIASLIDSNGFFDYRACGHLLQHCANHSLLFQGKQIHARLILLSVIPDNFLASKLVSVYSKSGEIHHARKVFDEIPHRNIFSFNAMLIAYSSHDQHSEALRLFSSLASFKPALKPDSFTISSLLKALSSVPLPHPILGKEIHASVLRHGFDSDLFVTNALVTFYARSGDLDLARKVFDGMPDRDIVSWNAMISGYSQNGYCDACLRLYQEMEGSTRLQPNGVTVVCVLYACAELKDLAFGMEVHRSVVKSRIEMDPSVCNSVICFYAKCGSLDYARSLFDEMMERDVVSYGAMICGYMTYGFVDQAMDLFRQMESPALSTWNATISGLAQNNRHSDVLELISEMLAAGYKPNSVTLASVLPTFSFFSNLSSSKQIHCYAIRNDCDRNVYVATALIDTYAKAGFLRGAHQVFAMTKGKSVIVWTAIIYAHATHGDANTALTLFGDMLAAGTSPDPVTFTAVLSACMHAGLVEKAKGIFNSMLLEYGIQPALEHYACIAGVLARAGMLNEAVEYVCQMPIEPNAKVWGALLNGASISGNVELGRFISDRLFEIEPENTGNYIVMANIYSRTRKWEEAEKVREKMKRQGLKKVPGYSWIETGKGLQSFVSGDTLNQNREETCWMLESLSGVMRELGYVYVDELDEESVVS
ncbi:pentatricopeptide repeat-containing protein At2g37310 isoform X1 [Magnolia sinica]|uniref:pentatricopeptide repeat-containing protein At2g37310 isoform X1 n=1 Tax=Magnolia sinica TaxID=86752 RepID=UPI00265847F3|nr:pentatricopeptide repeat-containing protein At2g37310 isoform X1 [Magnolia sinica]